MVRERITFFKEKNDMKHKTKLLLFAVMCVLVLPVIFANGNAQAAVYNGDGAIHDGATGLYVVPPDTATCFGNTADDPEGTAPHSIDISTIEEGSKCNSIQPAWFATTYPDSATCTGALLSWSSSRGCRNAYTDNPDPAYAAARTAHECLYCHSGGHASNRAGYLLGGHKNMARVADGLPWAGSIENGQTIYSGYNWNNPGISANGTSYKATTSTGTPVFWIYDGWIGTAPRNASPGGSYNCGRCHTTGWSADDAMQTTKEPYATFGANIFTDINLSAYDDSNVSHAYSSWDQWGIECSKCHNAVDGGHANTGPEPDMEFGDVVGYASQNAKCYNCHRQVDSHNLPLDAQTRLIGEQLQISDSHGAPPLVIKSHANGFLNSPHARFSGTYGQLDDPTKYDSHFFTSDGSCAGCHNTHDSVTDTLAGGKPWNNECGLDCHGQNTGPYGKLLSKIRHPNGAGTPLADATTADPISACETCHMPGGIHLFRISTDATYKTFTTVGQDVPTVPNADHNGFPEAFVDLDLACGQCHGGDATTVTTNGAPYFTKAQLSVWAMNMHNTDTIIPIISANYGSTNMDVMVNGSQSYCAPTATCGSFTYSWNFGDGSTAAGASATHTYTTAGEKLITLTVTDGTNEGVGGKVFYAVGTSMAPTADGSLATNANTWVATLVDSSTAATDPISLVVVKWGDGTSNTGAQGSTFTHTYTNAGLFIVQQQAIDTAARPSNVKTYASSIANFQLYTISGTVTKSDTTTPVAFATVKVVKDGTAQVVTLYTDANGAFTLPNRKPGSYTIYASQYGYTFDAQTVTIGPNATVNISAN
jgi:hypothetical protein